MYKETALLGSNRGRKPQMVHLKLSIPKPYAGEDRKIISILIRMHLGITPGSSTGKEPSCNAGELGSIPGFGRSPGEGNHYPLQYFGLENYMDCIVHGVAKGQT